MSRVESDRIQANFAECDMEIVRSCDYLLYRSWGGAEMYHSYQEPCRDTRYVIARKS